MKALTIIIFVASLIAASAIVNTVQQLFMKLIGANAMFFSGGKKLFAIILVALVLSGLAFNLFGIA